MAHSKKVLSSTGERMLSAKKAAKQLSCAQDYVSKLCREGKLQGIQVEGAWFVEPVSLKAFQLARVEAKLKRSEELAQLRKQEVSTFQKKSGGLPTIGKTLALVLGSLLLLSIVVAAPAATTHKETQVATPFGQVDSPFFFPFSKIFSTIGALFASRPSPAVKNDTPLTTQPQTTINNYTTNNNTTNNNTYNNTTNSYVEQGGISQRDFDAHLNSLRQEIFSSINSVAPTYAGGGTTNNIALTQRIDKLDHVVISNATVHSLSGLTDDDIPDTITVSNYVPLTGGTINGNLTITGTCTGCGGSGGETNWSYFNGSGIKLATTTNQVLIGASSTSTLAKLEVVGGANFDYATSTSFFTTTSSSTNSFSTNATSTNFFATLASSTQLYGAGLASCNSGNVLTWSGGLFGCAADQTATGAANPFTWANAYGVVAAATSSPFWAQQGVFASSTSHFFSFDATYATTSNLRIGSLQGILYGTGGIVGTIATNTLGLLASSSISATAPLAYNVATGVFSIQQANGSQDGYLSSTDWNLFNNKISSTSLSAGAGISYNSSTGVITNTIGYPFPSNATSTTLTFNAGLLSVGSTTINGNATTTGTLFAAIASSTNLYGAGLATCNAGNVLTWSSGIFGCVADQTGSNSGFPFTPAENFAVNTSATSTALWAQAGIFASSTSRFAGISTISATTSLLSIGSLTGPLQAVNGLVSASSSLSQVYGGTGITSYTAGDIIYADASGNLAKLPIGVNGQVLKVTASLPAWGADQTSGGGGGASAWATTTDSLAVYPSNTSNVIIVGNSATTTLTSIFEVIGKSYFSNNVGIGTTSAAALFSVQGNALFSGNLTFANAVATGTITTANLSVGSLNGLLSATNGVVGTVATNTLGLLASSSISATAPLAYNVATGVFSIQQANGSQDGYLSSTDWNLFNNKISSTSLSAGAGISYNSATGVITNTLGYPFTPGTNFATTTSATSSSIHTAGVFFASSTVAASQFPYASSTALTISGTASTTNLTISSIASGSLLKTTTAGSVIAAVAGTDYAIPSQISAAFPFTATSYGNSTSTTIGFTQGLISQGSTTISGLTSGLVGNTNGLLYGFASSSLFGFTPASNATTLTVAGTANQITSSAGAQDLSANRTWTLSLPNHVIFPSSFQATEASTTNATSSTFAITNIASGNLLKTTTGGSVIAAVAGTDYATPSQISAAFPFTATSYGNSTSTTIGFTQGLLSVGSTTINGNATTTGTLFAAIASSTNLYGAGLATCNAGNVLTWSSGIFGCVADQTSTGQANAFTWATNFGVISAATSSAIWAQSGIFASSSSYFVNATTSSFAITGVASALLKTLASGAVVAAVAGTDYENPLTFTAPLSRSVNSISITQSGVGANGYLSSTDFNTFNNKISSTSLSGASVISYNSSTGVITTTPGTFAGSASSVYTFPGDLIVTGNSTTTNATTSNLYVSATVRGAGLTTCSTSADKLLWSAATGQFTCGTDQNTVASDSNWSFFNGSGIRPGTSTNQVLIGFTSTSSLSKLEVVGGATFDNATTTNGLSVGGTASVVGRLGLGTTSPSQKLTVVGGVILQTASGAPTVASSSYLGSGSESYASFVSGRYAYVAANGGGLKILDVSNPAAPVLVGTYSGISAAQSVVVAGKYAYVGDAASGLVIIDVSRPSSPALVSSVAAGNAYSLALSGRYVIVPDFDTAKVNIVDVANPVSPSIVGFFSTGGTPAGVAVSGKYVFAADNGDGKIYVKDITNPAAPQAVSTYTGLTTPAGLYVSGRYLYVSDSTNGLHILNISNPASLAEVGTYASTYYSVQVAGDYAYAANPNGGVDVLDVRVPASPSLIGSLSLAGQTRNVFVSGKYAYISTANTGVQVVELNGAKLPSASIGSLEANTANISENINVGGEVYVGGGLDVGLSGIFSRGNLAVFGSTTLTDFIASRGTTTNATSTTFFSTLGSFTNLVATGATTSALAVTGSSTISGQFNAVGGAQFNTLSASGAITSTATGANTLPFASTTNITSTLASTTNLTISSIVSGSLLKTTTAGSVIAAVAGTDYATPSQISSAFPFTPGTLGNSTSTLILFNAGLIASASSTIGDGTQTGGLTISGGATTTGNAYVGGALGVGVQNATANTVAVGSGNVASYINAASGRMFVGYDGSNAFIQGGSTKGLNFNVNNSSAGAGTAAVLTSLGSFGLGTTSPTARLTIVATSSASNIALFDIQSPTTGGIATTSVFSVNAIGSTTLFQIPSSLLKTDSNGTIIAAVSGTDYATPSQISAAFPFTATSYGNSTSTTIGFTQGLISQGSTTISGLTSGLVGNTNGLLYGFASSSLFGFTPASNATTLTVAGTANQITSSAGAQDLSANRTWTLSLPNHVIFPSSFQATEASTTNATSSTFAITNIASGNLLKTTTGGSVIAAVAGTDYVTPGTDSVGSWFVGDSNFGQSVNSTSTTINFTAGIFASSTSRFAGISTISATTTNLLSTGSTTIAGQLNAVGGATLASLTAGATTLSSLTVGSLSGVLAGNSGVTYAAATSSVTCSSGVSCGSTSYVLGSALSITNTGVTSLTAGNGIELSGSTGAVTVTNTLGYPFTPGTNFATTTSATSSSIHTAGVFFASSTVAASQFPYASSTALTISGTASTTNLTISSIVSGSLLKTTTAGSVIAAVAGTDYAIPSQIPADFTFTSNFASVAAATSSLTLFTNGLSASSTVRFGDAGGTQFVWSSSAGTLGVGSTTPWARLSADTSNLAAGVPSFVVGSSTRTDFVVTQAGNVGIGTTSPFFIGSNTTGLAISSPSVATLALQTTGSTGHTYEFESINNGNLGLYDVSSSTYRWYITNTGNMGIGTTSPFSRLSVDTSSLAAGVPSFVVGSSSRTDFVVTQAGNVGVGTTSSLTNLDVYGNLALSGSNRYFNFGATSTASSIGATGYGFRDNAGVLEFKNDGGVWNSVNTATTGPSFLVHKNGSNQSVTSAIATLLTWSTETFDTNNNFDLSAERFTPTVPGKYLFNLSVYCVTASSYCNAMIYKNGAVASESITSAGAISEILVNTNIILDMNGTTDYVEAYVVVSDTTSPTVDGTAAYTNFSGALIAPVYAGAGGGWTNNGVASYLIDNADLVGAGTSSPWAKLAVDTSNLTSGTPSFVVGSSTRTDFVVTQAGNVGIGTTTAKTLLSVQQSGTFPGINIEEISTATRRATLGFGLNAAANSGWVIGQGLFNTTVKDFYLYDATASATRLYVDTAGRVGIGSTTPWGRFSVDTTSLAAGVPSFVVGSSTRTDLVVTQKGFLGIGTTSPFRALSIGNTAIGGGGDLQVDGGVYIGSSGTVLGPDQGLNVEIISSSITATPYWDWKNLASEDLDFRMTFNPASNAFVFFASTSPGFNTFVLKGNNNVGFSSSTPWRTLSVTGTVGFDGLTTTGTSSTASNLCLNNSTKEVLRATVFVGCIGSSERFKHDIQPLSINSLDLLKQLKPTSFVYNEDETNTTTWGFIAEEVDKIDSHLAARQDGQVYNIVDRALFALSVGAIQELSLDLETIASTTASSTPKSQSFANAFFANLFARTSMWLADAGNGIANIFATNITAVVINADTVNAKTLCLEGVCVTKSQLQNLLNGGGAAAPPPPSGGSGTSTPDTEAPVVTLSGNNPATITMGDTYTDLGATVTDNVDQNLGFTVALDGGAAVDISQLVLDTSVAGEHSIVFSATDQAGNTGVATRVVTVVDPTATSTQP